MDDIDHLERLRAELYKREWLPTLKASSGRQALHVYNPAARGLNDDVTVLDGNYHWAWGRDICPVEDEVLAADRIQYVLRVVGS